MTVSQYQTLHKASGFNYSPYTVYNVSVLFPDDNKLAIKASQTLAKNHSSSDFILGSKKDEPKPHDTLYMIYAKKGKELEENLKKTIFFIASKWKEFTVPPDKYLHGADGMFEIKRHNTDEVRALQKEMVEKTQEFRDPEHRYARFTPPGDERTPEWHNSLPLHIRKNMEDYGYEELGKSPVGIGHGGNSGEEGLRIHTTLAKIPADEKINISQLPSVSAFKGEAKAIGIFEMGPNGTCPREIGVYPFKKAQSSAWRTVSQKFLQVWQQLKLNLMTLLQPFFKLRA